MFLTATEKKKKKISYRPMTSTDKQPEPNFFFFECPRVTVAVDRFNNFLKEVNYGH